MTPLPIPGAAPVPSYADWMAHGLVTPYYLRHQRVIESRDRLILQVGCDRPEHLFLLALANPGARLVAIDPSPERVNWMQQQVGDAFPLDLGLLEVDAVEQLGFTFDYINGGHLPCHGADPRQTLVALRQVLKPDGILRVNVHNALMRDRIHHAQELFGLMGALEAPDDFEVQLVVDTMVSLREEIRLKAETWNVQRPQDWDGLTSYILSNHLQPGDRSFTIPDLIALLDQTNLHFIHMVDFENWRLERLFKHPEALPPVLRDRLIQTSLPEQLEMSELIHPVHPRLDFWCAPGTASPPSPVPHWSDADWQRAIVHLHPALQQQSVKVGILTAVDQGTGFDLSPFTGSTLPHLVDGTLAALLLPLLDRPQSVTDLVQGYRHIRPIHPVTQEPTTLATALSAVKTLLTRLHQPLYVLLEQPTHS